MKLIRFLNVPIFTVLVVLLCSDSFGQAVDVKKQTDVLKKVGPKGQGHDAAIQAMKALNSTTGDRIPEMLATLDGASILSANWIRSAIESVTGKNRDEVSWKDVEAFLAEPDHSPFARRLAYELLVEYQPDTAKRLLPNMVNDTSLENRRDAVALLVNQANAMKEADKKDAAVAAYKNALEYCRSVEQTKKIVKTLDELDEKIDITTHLGFIVNWNVIGPFDNEEKAGFDVAYAPEKEIDLSSSHMGKDDKISWLKASTEESYGIVDFTKILDKHKGAIAYAYTEFVSDTDQQAQIRLGCINANKVWLNGEEVLNTEIYHAGTRVDQYLTAVKLNKGKNKILIKVCQNEQEEPWAQRWQFQLRVSDPTGKAIYSQKQ